MDTPVIARTLAELGNETRLAIFRLLVRAGDEGLAIGAIQRRLAIPASTLGFHLRGLVAAGLVSQERRGRTVLCRAELEALRGVLRALETECCSEAAGTRPAARDVA
jgi:DNA-binding transcriptional ArsR family regulator